MDGHGGVEPVEGEHGLKQVRVRRVRQGCAARHRASGRRVGRRDARNAWAALISDCSAPALHAHHTLSISTEGRGDESCARLPSVRTERVD